MNTRDTQDVNERARVNQNESGSQTPSTPSSTPASRPTSGEGANDQK